MKTTGTASLLLGLLAALAPPLDAQLDTGTPDQIATVHVLNDTPYSRRANVLVGLPFAEGEYNGAPIATAGGEAVQLEKLSAWPDGSWRKARAIFPARLAAQELRPVVLVQGGGSRPGFIYSPAVLSNIGKTLFGLEVDGEYIVMGSKEAPWEVIEDELYNKAWRCTGRVPNTPVWMDFTLELGTRDEHIRFLLRYGTSDITDPALTWSVGRISLHCLGGDVNIQHSMGKVLKAARPIAGVTSLTLMKSQTWGEGEGQALEGYMAYPQDADDRDTLLAEAVKPVLAASSDWGMTRALGPWGVIPPLPAGFTAQDAAQRAANDYRRFGMGDPWEKGPHQNNKRPADPGDQGDFSAVVLTMAAHGLPHRLHPVHRSVLQEGCRATHLRNPDGTAMEIAKQPNTHFWSNQLFWTSPNKLGKAITQNGLANPHRWAGHDRQHESVNYLYAFASITANRFALEEIQHRTDLWIASNQAFRVGNATIDGMGASRAVGRTLQVGSQLWLLTNRMDLFRAIEYRVGVASRQWEGGKKRNDPGPFKPVVARGPHGGNLFTEKRVNGKVDPTWKPTRSFTMPWQDAFAAMGMDAWYQVSGNTTARDLSVTWSHQVMTYGVFDANGRGAWTAAKATEWKGAGRWDGMRIWHTGGKSWGDPTAPDYNPPNITENYVELYGGYNIWLQACTEIAKANGYDPVKSDAFLARTRTSGKDEPAWRAREWRAVR